MAPLGFKLGLRTARLLAALGESRHKRRRVRVLWYFASNPNAKIAEDR